MSQIGRIMSFSWMITWGGEEFIPYDTSLVAKALGKMVILGVIKL